MTAEQLIAFLLRCIAFNYALLLAWFGVFAFAHDWLYRLHSRWFRLSLAAFDAINYGGIAAYKIGLILFFVVPAIAIATMRP